MKEYKIDLSMYEGKVLRAVSEAIQRHAFELGYEWGGYGKKEILTNMSYLFFNKDCDITHVVKGEKRYFEERYGTLISATDFLALTPEDVKDAPKEPEPKPFDRVLVRNSSIEEWHIDLFERYCGEKAPYANTCMSSSWKHCIPHEGNEHLLGTTEEPK
jgi:hypothetical protein